MKTTTIITAKIYPEIYQRIVSGQKRYEVRAEPFDGANVIHYVDTGTGKTLGYWTLGVQHWFSRADDSFVFTLAGVSEKEFYKLFPITSLLFTHAPQDLYVAPIGYEIYTLSEAVKVADYS